MSKHLSLAITAAGAIALAVAAPAGAYTAGKDGRAAIRSSAPAAKTLVAEEKCQCEKGGKGCICKKGECHCANCGQKAHRS